LRDAFMHVADQPADGGLIVAERQLTRRRNLEAHLLLDVGDVDPVACTDLAGLPVAQELRYDEQRQAFRARPVAVRPRKDEVDDVLRHVPLATGDEALHALDVPGAVGLLNSFGATGP